VENGFVNLVAVVGFLIVAIGLIPMVLFLGSKLSSSPNEQTDGAERHLAGTPRAPKHD
jgi:hypothetical protein